MIVDCEGKTYKLHFQDLFFENSSVAYACEAFTNGVYRINLFENKVVPLFYNTKGYADSLHLSRHILLTRNKVITLPFFGEYVAIYDVEENSDSYLKLEDKYKLSRNNQDGFYITHSVKYNNINCCFGLRLKAVLEINEDLSFCYDNTLYRKIGLYTEDEEYVKYPLYISDCDNDGNIIAIFRDCDSVIKYNLVNKSIEFIFTHAEIGREIISAEYDGDFFWLISSNPNRLIRVDVRSKKITNYGLPIGWECPEGKYTFGIVDCDKTLLLYPFYSDRAIWFDKEKGCMEFADVMDIPSDSQWKFDSAKRYNNKVYLSARYDKCIYELEIASKEIKKHQFLRPVKEILGNRLRNSINGYVMESVKDNFDLASYIECIENKGLEGGENKGEDVIIGKDIYKEIMEKRK